MCEITRRYTMVGLKVQETDDERLDADYARMYDNLRLSTRLYENMREHPIVCDNTPSYTTVRIILCKLR